jgi:6-phosphogluconolactonase (cycloisomerase 2 family)
LVYYPGLNDTGGVNVEAAAVTTAGDFTPLTVTAPDTTGQFPNDMTIVNGKFVYVAMDDTGAVEGFSIDSGTGTLTPIAGSPFTPIAAEADNVVSDPQGRFLFVSGAFSSVISVFQIDATTGALTEAPGSPFGSFNLSFANSLTVDGTGQFLYVGQVFDIAPLDEFMIDQNNGALSEFASFDLGVAQLHADSSGKFLLGVKEPLFEFGAATDPHIYVFAIDPLTGAPSPVAGSPFATTSAPFDFTISPNGEFVYVMGNDPSTLEISPVEGYSIDGTSGALTALAGSPFATLPSDLVQCKFESTGETLVCTSSSLINFSALTANTSTGDLSNTVPDLDNVFSFPFAVTN